MRAEFRAAPTRQRALCMLTRRLRRLLSGLPDEAALPRGAVVLDQQEIGTYGWFPPVSAAAADAGRVPQVSQGSPVQLRALCLTRERDPCAEAAYDPHEELAVDNEYEAAMPFRDPGHISRAEIRLAHALARSGTTKRDETWDFIKPLWGKYIQAMRDVSAASRARARAHVPALRVPG